MPNKLLIICLSIAFSLCSCDRELSVTQPASPIPQGSLDISTSPEGYEIIVNERLSGKYTPDSLVYIEEGTYNLTFRHPIYIDTSITVQIEKDQKKSVLTDCTQHPLFHGKIKCYSIPNGADIFIDNESTGYKTPHTFEDIFPGSHKASYRKTGHTNYNEDFRVNSNQVLSLGGVLEDTTIWMFLHTGNSPIPTNYIRHLELGDNGSLWVGTFDGGIVNYNDGVWKLYNISNRKLPGNMITDMASNYGIMWVGTTVGAAKIINDRITIYNKSNSMLPDNNISAVGCTGYSYGGLIGTQNKGAMLIDHNGFHVYDITNSEIPSNHITSISNAGYNMFFGTDEGLAIRNTNNNSWKFINTSNSNLPKNRISKVIPLDNDSATKKIIMVVDNVLNSSQSSLVLYEEGEVTIKEFHCAIYNIHHNYNITWLSTSKGLIKLKDLEIDKTFDSSNTPLNENTVYDMVKDPQGSIWMATDDGLVRYKGN